MLLCDLRRATTIDVDHQHPQSEGNAAGLEVTLHAVTAWNIPSRIFHSIKCDTVVSGARLLREIRSSTNILAVYSISRWFWGSVCATETPPMCVSLNTTTRTYKREYKE